MRQIVNHNKTGKSCSISCAKVLASKCKMKNVDLETNLNCLPTVGKFRKIQKGMQIETVTLKYVFIGK